MASGHIYGPFDKNKISELLLKGVLTGEEEASEYPAGDWESFSHAAELTEIFMQVLSQGSNPSKKNKIKPSGELPPIVSENKEEIKVPLERGTVKSKILKAVPPLSAQKSTTEFNEKRRKKSNHKQNFIPLLIIGAAIALFVVGLTHKRVVTGHSLNLISPQPKEKSDANKSREQFKIGWGAFYKDTFLNYIKAEEFYVRAVEESPGNVDAIVMLLLTDYELWPFVRQDSHDQAVIQWLLQAASRADLYGQKRALATAIADTLLSYDVNSKSQIDSGLIADPTEGRFYELKAQNFYNSADYDQARNYFEKAATLLPYWVKPQYMLGVCYSKLGQASQAKAYLNKALEMNPNHSGARLEMGVVEEIYFNHSEKAKEDLILAFESPEKLLPQTEARGRVVLAQIYKKSGDDLAALKQASLAYALNPSDPALRDLVRKMGGDFNQIRSSSNDKQYMQLGEEYWRMKNYLASQAQFKAAFEANSGNATAAMRAGESLWRLHQPQEAIDYLQKAISADPKLVSAYVKLTDYKTTLYNFEGAADTLEQGFKANPRNYEILRAYGLFYYRRGDFTAAESYVQRALQSYETDVLGNQLMAKILLGKKNVVKAEEYAKRAVQLDPRNAEAQVTFGKIRATFEGVANAVGFFQDLINTYPSTIEYRIGLSEVYIQDEQYDEAKKVLNQVVQYDPNNKEAFLLLGDANYFNRNGDGALQAYLSAARIDPSDPAGLFRSGEVYTKAGKYQEAVKQFQLVARINPKFPLTHYNLAKVYFKSGTGDLALKELKEEERLNPRLADPWELSGDINLTLRKYQQAAQDYQRASELKPQTANIYVKQAKAYHGAGALDSALAMLRLAEAKESGFAEIYREQGYIFEQKGMAGEAVGSFQQYLRLDPNPPDKAVILDKMKDLE